MNQLDIRTYSVLQYNKSVSNKVETFPVVWVFGVITQLREKGRWVYLTLGQFEENNPKPLALLDVMMSLEQFQICNRRFKGLASPFQIQVQLKMCLQLKARYYEPFGKFTPWVLAIDESFTLGELALTRQKILDRLRAEGLLTKNKNVPTPPLWLRIGLITASDSAAYADFIQTVRESGYSFQIILAEARMQGEQTEATVLAALEKLSRLSLDCICLIRGGGAKMDLVYFDSEKICRSLAECPVPVLTGIGHEIDSSLADTVSYQSLITPTACARFLVEKMSRAHSLLIENVHELEQIWAHRNLTSHSHLQASSIQLNRAWKLASIQEISIQANLLRQIGYQFKTRVSREQTHLQTNYTGMKQGLRKILAYEKQYLQMAQRQVRAADPARLMKLGWAWVRNAQGQVLRSLKDVKAQDQVSIQSYQVTLNAQVIQKDIDEQ